MIKQSIRLVGCIIALFALILVFKHSHLMQEEKPLNTTERFNIAVLSTTISKERLVNELNLHTAYGRDQIQRNHPACTAKGSHSGGLYGSCRRDCCLFHSSPGTAVVAVIIGCTVFDVCTVEFCWVYFLFEARVFANVI